MNNRTETLKLILSGDGKLLGAELGRGEQHVKRYTNRMQAYFGRMNHAIGMRIKSLLTNPLAIVGGAAGLLYAGKQVIDYKDKLSTLALNAGLTAKQLFEMDNSIYRTAYATGQTRDQIVATINEIYDKTGDFKFTEDSIYNVAVATTAMSADMRDAGRVLTAMKNGMNATSNEAKEYFDILAKMGDIGKFTFAEQSSQAERLFGSSAMALKLTKENFVQYAAFVQAIRPGFSSSDIAATAVERIMMDLVTKKKIIKKAVGFKVFDEKGGIINFERTIKAISRMDITKQTKIFGEFSRAFLSLDTKDRIKEYDRLIEKGRELGAIQERFGVKSGEAKFQINALTTAAQQFADAGITPVLRDLTKALSEITGDPAKMKKFIDDINAIARASGAMAQALFVAASSLAKIYGFMDKSAAKKRSKTEKLNSDLMAFGNLPKEEQAEYYRKNAFKYFGGRQSIGEFLETQSSSKSAPSAIQESIKRSSTSAKISVAAPEVKNNYAFSIAIPESGPVVVSSNDPNASVTVKSNRGSFK